MTDFDQTSPAQGHQALNDIDQIRNNLTALRNLESSLEASPPSNPEPGQFWRATDTKKLYQRNQANDAWLLMWFEPAAGSGYGPAWYYPTGEDNSDRNLKTHLDKNITAAVAVHGIKQGSGNGLDADKVDGYEASDFAAAGHNHDTDYEPIISPKNSAFNKNFGTGAGTVAEGDHGHEGSDLSNIPQSSLTNYSAGESIIASADATVGPGLGSSWNKKKEIVVARNGTLRISFSLYGGTSGDAYGRVYRNGSPVGQIRSVTHDQSNTFPEDISGWSPGDKAQLYVYETGSQDAEASDFRIKNSFYTIEKVLLD